MTDDSGKRKAEPQESEEKYRTFFHNSSDAMLIIQDDRFVDCNHAAVTMLRYENKEGFLNTHPSVLSPEFQPDGKPSYDKAIEMMEIARAQGSHRFEWNHTRKNGEVFPVEVSLTAIPAHEGALLHTIWRDITHRKETERALQKSEALLNATGEMAKVGGWEIELPSQKLTWTKEVYRIHEIADDFEPTVQNAIDFYTPEQFSIIETALQRAIEEGAPFDEQLKLITAKGNSVWVRALGQAHRENGAVVKVSGAFQDITSTKEAEQALLESQLKYSAVVENVFDAILVVQDQKIVFINQPGASMAGYSVAEMLGKPFLDFVAPENRNTLLERYVSRIAGNSALPSYEFSILCKDGSKKATELSVTTIHYGDGLATVAIIRDITERKQAEETRIHLERQVQHAQKLESLGVLAGGIAHDFNNILMAVLGFADLALQDISESHPAYTSVQEIEKGALRAAELTRQMLAYSGKGHFVITTLDVSALINDMADLLRTSVARTIALKLRLEQNLPAIEGDTAQMQQVVMNLITNAAEAIEDKIGVIALSTGIMNCGKDVLAQSLAVSAAPEDRVPEGDYVFFEVRDTGCGMREEVKTRIFEPFFTTKFTGRGLGMAAVLGIVRGHKGAILLNTEAGKGTTFKVLFPALKGARVAQEMRDVSGMSVQPKRGTILVVDDEKVVHKLARQILERHGFHVLSAEDGKEGVNLFRKHADTIRCVLLDLTMPNMDGEQCFEELRRIKEDVAVVLSSGYSEQEVSQRFVNKGLAGFLQKPYRSATLIEKIQRTLGE
jgi:two-component system, cell cycle sensor histidine kinase and response regulator CckA